MKNYIKTAVLCAAISTHTFAQKEFTQEWKFTQPVETRFKSINGDATFVLAGDFKEIAMMDASAGKLLWKMNFKEKYGKKTAERWVWEEEPNVVEVTVKGENKNEEILHYIDGLTGNEIDKQVYDKKKQAKTRREWFPELKNRVIAKTMTEADGCKLYLDYEKKVATGAARPKKTTATVTCSGKYEWKQALDIKVVRNLCSGFGGSGEALFGGDFLDIAVNGDKVFVLYEGISVLDLKTGKLLWETTFDNSDFDFGLFKSVQEVGRAAYPLTHDNALYVVDLSKENRCIKKLDLNTGTPVWTGEKLDNDVIVPATLLVNNTLVAQFGGKIQKQSYIPGTNGNPDVCKSEFKMIGDYGVKAYDSNTGKLIWQTFDRKELGDKFSSLITNIVTDGKNIFVGSSKNIYCFEAGTGKIVFSVPAEQLKIGKPDNVWLYQDKLIVECEEGVASLDAGNGKINFATDTKKCLSTFSKGNAFFVWVGKNLEDMNAFVRLDLNTGAILGKITDTAYPYFTSDGEHFVKFDDGNVLRYSTR